MRQWVQQNHTDTERLTQMINDLQKFASPALALLSVAVSEAAQLAHTLILPQRNTIAFARRRLQKKTAPPSFLEKAYTSSSRPKTDTTYAYVSIFSATLKKSR